MSRRNRTAASRRRVADHREQRRATLNVLLARMQRGALLGPERDQLAGIIGREVDEAEELRRGLAGQQAAAKAAQTRAEAAEAAIVEAEQDRDDARRRLAGYVAVFGPDAVGEYHRMQHRAKTAEATINRVRALAADMHTWCSPNGLAPQYARDIEQALTGDRWCGHMPGCDCPAEQAVTAAPAVEAEQRLATIRATTIPAAPPVPEAYRAPAGDPRAVLDHIRDARQWSDIQAHLGMFYGWTAVQSGQRARAYRIAIVTRAEAAVREALRERDKACEAFNAATLAREDAEKRAKQAERRLDCIRAMANAWVQRLPSAIVTATAAQAVRQAADGDDSPVMFGMTPEPGAQEQRERAERAEQRLAAEQQHAADQGKTISRLMRELGDAEQRAHDTATTLRRTEDDLADTRRRLAERTTKPTAPTLQVLHHACGQLADVPGNITMHPDRLSWPGHDCPADRAAVDLAAVRSTAIATIRAALDHQEPRP